MTFAYFTQDTIATIEAADVAAAREAAGVGADDMMIEVVEVSYVIVEAE